MMLILRSYPENERLYSEEARTPKARNCFLGEAKQKGGRIWTLPCPPGHGHSAARCVAINVVTVDHPLTINRLRNY